ncbi:30S ribosomal protein S16 [Acidocella sp.]|uniref:30S ribosomal protein S16 n=1 Tax=Acidocella sp. TaxID=50710 RepID=UPI003D074CEA
MSVKIRLSRAGAKKRPFYHIVIADANAPRDGKFIERVGTYNPMLPAEHAERVTLKTERLQYWLSTGAQATDRVARFLAKAELMKAPVHAEQPKQSLPKKKAQERAAAKAKAEAAA